MRNLSAVLIIALISIMSFYFGASWGKGVGVDYAILNQHIYSDGEFYLSELDGEVNQYYK